MDAKEVLRSNLENIVLNHSLKYMTNPAWSDEHRDKVMSNTLDALMSQVGPLVDALEPFADERGYCGKQDHIRAKRALAHLKRKP